MPSPALLQDRIEQALSFATMDDAMRVMPEVVRTPVHFDSVDDSVVNTMFKGASSMEGAPSDIYILPFGNSIEKGKSPQIMLRAWLAQAAIAGARGEDPRELIVVSQNGQWSKSMNFSHTERKHMAKKDENGVFSLRPITDRMTSLFMARSSNADKAVGTVAGHSLGAELGLQFALNGRGDVEIEQLLLSGSVRHAERRPITQLLMRDFANASPHFSQQIAETGMPVLMDYYGVTKDKLPKLPPGSVKYVLQAATLSNLALRRWLASDGFNKDLATVLENNPDIRIWNEQGDCKLERPKPSTDVAAADVLVGRFGKRLIYDFVDGDHGRADAVPDYATTLYEKSVELANAA
jgi:hypothetical protein